jgi:hypothetical protein
MSFPVMLVSRFLRAGSVRARAPAAAWMSSGPSVADVIPAGEATELLPQLPAVPDGGTPR